MIAFAYIFIYFQPKRQIGSLEMINTFFDCFKMLVVISVNCVLVFFNPLSLYSFDVTFCSLKLCANFTLIIHGSTASIATGTL